MDDLFGFGGWFLIILGLYAIYPPIAFIFCGASFLIYALAGEIARQNRQKEQNSEN